MELFITSNLPSASFISDVSLDSLASSSGSLGSEPHHQDFVKFMQHVIAMNVEVLAMTWDPVLERFNRGGSTGTVSTSGVNADLVFSYKRFRLAARDPHFSEEQFRKLQYAAITNELMVLASPGVRHHDNIVRLVGVCFELSPDGADAWPVLVLLTANSGELTRVVSDDETVMGERVMLRICGEVAKGLDALHQNGIFHCDVNPRNILAWRDAPRGGLAILLADFGFSKFGAADDLVKLPQTEPWDAAEWHSREFRVRDLRKMDMYSFGLVCLWLFFRKDSLVELGLPSATVESALLAIDPAALTRVQVKKAEGNSILNWANQLVRKSDLGSEVKSCLKQVFDLSLDADPARRASSMAELTRILLGPSQQRNQDGVMEPIGVVIPDWHGALNIAQMLTNLEACDYRVHRFLTRSLGEMADGLEGCERCRQNAAFQLAICHRVGFGVDPEHDNSIDWLSSAGKTPSDLTTALESIKSFKPDHMYNPVDFLAKLGYHGDVGSKYEADGILGNAVRHYQEMVLMREQSLGPEHFSTMRLKITLARLLRRDGRFEDAMQIVVGMTGLADMALTERVAVNTLLARLWADLGDVEQAEPALRHLLTWYDGGPESNNLESLGVQQDLILLLLERGKVNEALELALKHADECRKGLGLDHEGTRGAYMCLAASYDASGKLGDAVKASECIEDMAKRPSAVRVSKRAIVRDTASLGVRYFRHGDQGSSWRCYEKVKQLVGQDSAMASVAVYAANSVLLALVRRGDNHEQAAEMLAELLAESARVLGPDARETMTVMGNLAGVYSTQQRLDDAVGLGRRVVSSRRRTLGDAHPDTIVAMGDVRHALLQQGKFPDAAEVAAQELVSLKQYYGGSFDDQLVGDIETLGRAMESAGAMAEAIPFLEEEIILRRAARTGGDAEGGAATGLLSALARVASCRLHVGELSAARELTAELLPLIPLSDTDAPEENGRALLSDMVRLAKKCLEKECVTEAGQILSSAADLLSRVTADHDSQAALETARYEYLRKIGREAEGTEEVGT